MIIYQGPSVLDGAPIVAIATMKTSNRKTGAMAQIWILRADTEPHHAVKTGADVSVCGNCPHRHYTGGACYVTPFHAPLAVFRAWKRGVYPALDLEALRGKPVRFGAYGDPAAVPFSAWAPILEVCGAYTGYTHQANHKRFDKRIATFCQVSVDTPKQAERAHAKGYKTFRVASDASKRFNNEIECLADSKGVACADCLLCDGTRQNIVIAGHGARASSVKFHDVIARA